MSHISHLVIVIFIIVKIHKTISNESVVSWLIGHSFILGFILLYWPEWSTFLIFEKKVFTSICLFHYIYIYIYIHCHPQTDCFVESQLYSVARHVWRLNPGSKLSNFTLDLVSDRSDNQHTTLTKGIIRYYVATAAAASVYLHFYTLSATRVLNSFGELCIMQAAAENSFARVLNPHGGA